MIPRDEAIRAAGRELAEARAERDEQTPREAALAAHVPGGPSVDELEQRIRARRELSVQRKGAA